MARPLDPIVLRVLKEHGYGPDAIWEAHGTPVIYHRVLEQIAAKMGVKFDPPQIIEANGEAGVASVCVTGAVNGTSVWSIGEAAPKNNKNAYPWAMAEKRAKDRVILKLLGLSGFVYSEDEAPEFKLEWKGPLKTTELKLKAREFAVVLKDCNTLDDINTLRNAYVGVLEQLEYDLPDWFYGADDVKGAQQAIADKLEQCQARTA